MLHASRLVALVVPALLALSACMAQESVRDADGVITEANDRASVFEMAVGDCYDEPDDTEAEQLDTLPAVPCGDPHDFEVYASVAVDGEEFPGEAAVEKQAETNCKDEFETFVGTSWDDSELDFTFLYPTASSWPQGDREITCLVVAEDKVTGTLEGSER